MKIELLHAARLEQLNRERDFIAMGYAGDVSCLDCFTELSGNKRSQLVDVRTAAEWAFVGVPDLTGIGKRPILREWQSYPTMEIDPDFAQSVSRELNEVGTSQDDAVYFLCRSGVRSKAAASALTELGYTKTYNVLAGFEGAHDEASHRGNKGGWKFEGLPWKQS